MKKDVDMTTVYECLRCKKLYRSNSDAMRCCNSGTIMRSIAPHETDILENVLGVIAADMIIESLLDSDNSSSSSLDSSSDFSSGGGDFGGGGASGDW